mgnify:CR=1 FL=1
MNHRRPPLPAIIIVLLLISVSAYFIVTQTAPETDGVLTASGSIEAVTVNVSPSRRQVRTSCPSTRTLPSTAGTVIFHSETGEPVTK